MELLLDTHTMLWFLWADSRLSANALSMIVVPSNRKHISIASCWEIAIKVCGGKLSLGESATTFLPREIQKNNFLLLPISLAHATGVEALPLHHRDPFDRLLVAQAALDNLTLISADPMFDSYGIRRLW